MSGVGALAGDAIRPWVVGIGPPPKSCFQVFHKSCPIVLSALLPLLVALGPAESVPFCSGSILTAHLLAIRFRAVLCWI